MKRQDALNLLRFAGYHGDSQTLVRVRCEERVSQERTLETYRAGQQAKTSGIPCHCTECKAVTP